jgi:hypothetical protein
MCRFDGPSAERELAHAPENDALSDLFIFFSQFPSDLLHDLPAAPLFAMALIPLMKQRQSAMQDHQM